MRTRITVGSVGVYVERNAVNPLYDELVNRAAQNAEDFPFATKKDLFMLAACVGAQHKRFEEVPADKRIQIFDGETFKQDTDVPILAALAYQHTQDLDVLFEPGKIIRIAEGYAQGGIRIVYQRITTGSANRPLYNLVDMVTAVPEAEGNLR
jgi:hypothetical protein